MKGKIVNLKDLPPDLVKGGRPRAKLPRRELLLSMREQGLTLREISSRTGIPHSTLGDALKGKLTPKQMKAKRRRARRKRRATIEI